MKNFIKKSSCLMILSWVMISNAYAVPPALEDNGWEEVSVALTSVDSFSKLSKNRQVIYEGRFLKKKDHCTLLFIDAPTGKVDNFKIYQNKLLKLSFDKRRFLTGETEVFREYQGKWRQRKGIQSRLSQITLVDRNRIYSLNIIRHFRNRMGIVQLECLSQNEISKNYKPLKQFLFSLGRLKSGMSKEIQMTLRKQETLKQKAKEKHLKEIKSRKINRRIHYMDYLRSRYQ